ncbi:MAG TPA: C40 family peptidase [Stackebrandtia sp.]|jgi:cell wall-associated NlpC family hydrolase|uniref:C40 family peptidase n=1 Tax=Stackebrandtia sp. TaxID=2023065 RepID=UPI002D73296D|nr:C40 family peptidase [Stackebrandtia sp.]HZE40688.1 C40 family peptidase [Stackebrandtia sp.]
MKTTPPPRRRRGRAVLCVGTALALATAFPAPAFADPSALDSVPDGGSHPDGADPGYVPGTDIPQSGPGIARGPYANKIAEQTHALARLGEKTNAAADELKARKKMASSARDDWSTLDKEARDTEELASEMAADAYERRAAEIPGVTERFDSLFQVNPGLLTSDRDAVVSEATDAAETAAAAKASLDAAVAAEEIADGTHQRLSKKLKKDTATLKDLIAKNAKAIELEDEQTAASDAHKATDIGSDTDGMEPSKDAAKAVAFALTQRGKEYVWGDEGPNSYDCSGLVQTSYGKVGDRLPRVAADQFHSTLDREVGVAEMLPGDLIFYGDSVNDWTSVYHVAMYIGHGEMVQAPRPGDVVKVVPVSFSEFVGAHRVAKAASDEPAKPSRPEKDSKHGRSDGKRDREDGLEPRPDPSPGRDDPWPGNGDDPAPNPTPTPVPGG